MLMRQDHAHFKEAVDLARIPGCVHTTLKHFGQIVHLLTLLSALRMRWPFRSAWLTEDRNLALDEDSHNFML